ncbi:MAG: hypothetical protein LW823_09130 [Rickettsiales bacterium]|jgi:hypothetical protein|nr:hypothetical protein [Rickettsiales bacterium]
MKQFVLFAALLGLSGCYYCKLEPGDATSVSGYWNGCMNVMKDAGEAPLWPNQKQ